jgi:ribose transport system substrate-binding protein
VYTRRSFCAALSAAFTVAVGCGGKRRKVIAFIPKATSHLFWASVQAGALAAGQELGVEILWTGPARETDYLQQIQIVDSMVARHVDGIAVAATERIALIPPIDRAMAGGIPVAVFDSGIDSLNYTTFLATNNYEAGQFGGRALAELIHGSGRVGLLMHAPGSESTMDRERGFDDLMQSDYPNIQVVAREYGMSDPAKSQSAAEKILSENPELDGLFASSEPSSAGAVAALRSKGRAGKTRFVSFDSSDALVNELRAGVIDAMVVQDPFRMGFESVRMLVNNLEGRTPAKRVDLHARVVRKDDLEKPEIRALLNPDIARYAKP